jgi:hypothetical protein
MGRNTETTAARWQGAGDYDGTRSTVDREAASREEALK